MQTTSNDVKPGAVRILAKAATQAEPGMDRREFLKAAVATSVLAGALPAWAAESEQGVPYRRLGRTVGDDAR